MEIEGFKEKITNIENLLGEEKKAQMKLLKDIENKKDLYSKKQDEMRNLIQRNTQNEIQNSILDKKIEYLTEELENEKNQLNERIENNPESEEYLQKVIALLKEINIRNDPERMKDIVEQIKQEKANKEREEAEAMIKMKESMKTSIHKNENDNKKFENEIMSTKPDLQNVIYLEN